MGTRKESCNNPQPPSAQTSYCSTRRVDEATGAETNAIHSNLNRAQDTRANRTRHTTSSSTQPHAKQQLTNAPQTNAQTSRSHAHTFRRWRARVRALRDIASSLLNGMAVEALLHASIASGVTGSRRGQNARPTRGPLSLLPSCLRVSAVPGSITSAPRPITSAPRPITSAPRPITSAPRPICAPLAPPQSP